MIDLEPKDYELAQKLFDNIESLDIEERKAMGNFVLMHFDEDSKTLLESTASALKGLGEFMALIVFVSKLVHDKDYPYAWKRYCEFKSKDFDVVIIDCPSVDLHMRLFQETKCFLFEPGKELFDIPHPDTGVEDIEIALEDPGIEKLRDIYQRFGNGKQVPNKPIAEIMQEILNVYRIRTKVIGKRLLKLPTDDFLSCYVIAILLGKATAGWYS